MVQLNTILLVAPDFARIGIVFVVGGLLALKLFAPRSRSRTQLPLWRAMSTAILILAPLYMLTASLGLVAWGLMARDDFHTALTFLWARDIVKQLAWVPFDMGVLYFFYPTVVLALFPSVSFPRNHLLALFIAALLVLALSQSYPSSGTRLAANSLSARILNVVSLVVPAMLSPVQIFSCVVFAVLAALLAAPAALLSSARGIPLRSNPWIALCVALLFELATVALEINYGTTAQVYYTQLIVAACASVCAVTTMLAVFHSPLAIQASASFGERPTIIVTSDASTIPECYSPTASMYGSPVRGSGGGPRMSASADSDFLALRDPFASPPPGQLSPMMREKVRHIASPQRLAHASQPKRQATNSLHAHRESDASLGAMGSFDQAFLERLVSLSFESSDDSHSLSESAHQHHHRHRHNHNPTSTSTGSSSLEKKTRTPNAAALDGLLLLEPAARISHVQLPMFSNAHTTANSPRRSASKRDSYESSRSLTPTPAPRRGRRASRPPTPAAELALLASPAASSKDWTRELERQDLSAFTFNAESGSSPEESEFELDKSLELALRR
ncbi:hypothetical protein EXIGLDRAFT_821957 [Exidia glandulosa HHB12029]|uniref:Uncharacterized protein n=1 Tax=Exidia glandulosa HHB12029 TaxID=1314781 RepID=A0A165JM13_EXIGL|nr:hypothetical protein EXIGLDRAFT_821957 [Exidia glandulosa HHB12029]